MYRSCICRCLIDTPTYECTSELEREHGWLEQRNYRCFAPRWRAAGFQTLTQVKQTRQALSGDKLTEETGYSLRNAPGHQPTDGANLCTAIEGHWRVETMHYRRDVVLSEDSFRTNMSRVSCLLSSIEP